MPAKARASDLKPQISKRLKAARAIVWDSSDGCAIALGVSKNTWRNYEIGERYPDPFWAVQFCESTGFTMDFLYRGHMRGVAEDVGLRLAAARPDLVDEAPDVGHPATATVPA